MEELEEGVEKIEVTSKFTVNTVFWYSELLGIENGVNRLTTDEEDEEYWHGVSMIFAKRDYSGMQRYLKIWIDGISYGGDERILAAVRNLEIYGINPIAYQSFGATEDILRWLGYGALYDRPDTCLFSHQSFEGVPEADIVEVPVWVPMLDCSDAPMARFVRGVITTMAWDCTHLGCDLVGNPHISPSRSLKKNRRSMHCAITAKEYQDDGLWANSDSGDAGFPIIPVHPEVRGDIARLLALRDRHKGYPANEWTASLLMPHVPHHGTMD
jgi:hypothetical protein